MGQLALISRAIDAFVPRAQTTLDPNDDRYYEPSGSMRCAAGQSVTPQTALTFSACWAATNAIAGLFGALPLKSYKPTPDGRTEAKKHPTWKIFTREPNPEMDSFVFWEMMTQWWINYGNAFAEIQRLEDSGRLFALWPIHPSRVSPERNSSGIWSGRWVIRNKNAGPSYLESSEMLNIIGALSDDGLMGKGVFNYAAQSIGVGLAEQKYKGEFYANGGRPTGLLKHPKSLSPGARDELRREWKEIHSSGSDIAVLWEGMEYASISIDPEHAKLLDSQLFSVQEMSRFYDLPPHVLYELSKGTFANVEEMNRFLVSQPIGKRLVRVEKALDRQLFTDDEKDAGYYCKFNVNTLLRGDPKQQAEINQIKLQNGVISQDEWRTQDDLNKLPDGLGEQYWMRRDMATTELVLSAADLQQSAPIPGNPPTPETPPTPPVPDPKNKWPQRAKQQRKLVNALRDELACCKNDLYREAGRLSAALENTKAAEQSASEAESRNAQLMAQVAALTEAKAAVEAEWDTQTGNMRELEAKHHAAIAERDDLASKLTAGEACYAESLLTLEKATDKIGELQATIATHEAAEALAVKELGEARDALSALQMSLETEKAAKIAAESEVTYLEGQLTRSIDAKATIETQLEKSDARGESYKQQRDTLATELGTVRAERDTFKTNADRSAKACAELTADVAATKKRLEIAEKQAHNSEAMALAAETGAQERLNAARLTVAASVRGLLDESLKHLLADEADQIKNASRKPEQFKQIADGYYHHLQTQITAQLKHAAEAMSQVGAGQQDVAKVASVYVAESRTRVHNLIHKTPKADLRMAARQEVESWEPRRQTLLNWIGE